MVSYADPNLNTVLRYVEHALASRNIIHISCWSAHSFQSPVCNVHVLPKRRKKGRVHFHSSTHNFTFKRHDLVNRLTDLFVGGSSISSSHNLAFPFFLASSSHPHAARDVWVTLIVWEWDRPCRRRPQVGRRKPSHLYSNNKVVCTSHDGREEGEGVHSWTKERPRRWQKSWKKI